MRLRSSKQVGKVYGINPGDNTGFTPLHSAALRGHFEVWKFLCLNPEEKKPKNEEGFTPLHLADENGHLDVCKFLCSRLLDKNPRDDM